MEQNGTQTALQGSDNRSQEDKLVPTRCEGDDIPRRLDNLIHSMENSNNDLMDEAQKSLSERSRRTQVDPYAPSGRQLSSLDGGKRSTPEGSSRPSRMRR